MTSATYLATVNSINSALLTAGITTLVFTHKVAFTVNSILYPNIIDYLGYEIKLKEKSSFPVFEYIINE